MTDTTLSSGHHGVLVCGQGQLHHGPTHTGQHDILRGPQVRHPGHMRAAHVTYDASFQILNRGSEPNKLGPGHRKRAGKVSWILNGDWPLGQCWHLTFISPLVIIRDAGKYICTLETFPKQSLMVYLQVNGEFLSKHFNRQKKILQQFSKKYLNKRFSSSNSM